METVKSKILQEVENDAIRIQTRRFNEQLEDIEYKKSQAVVEAADADKKGTKV